SWIDRLAIDANGKIVAVGHAINQVKGSSSYVAFAVARYTSAGSLDSTFGSSGIVLTNFAPVSAYTSQNLGATSVLIQGDGKIDLAGVTASQMALARYTTAGQLDTQFNGTGIVTLPNPSPYRSVIHGVVVQNSGAIVVAGMNAIAPINNYNNLTLARLTST